MPETLPDFLVIGAMKTGTTSLHTYLRSHPQIFMPMLKEIDFFSYPDHWQKGLDWYEDFFLPAPAGAIKGEASTSYTKFPEYHETAHRIAETLPGARYIYCVRDPIDRLASHYRHEVTRGREHRPLADAVEEDPRYVDTSSYGTQLERHLQYVNADRVLVVRSEELRQDRRGVMRTVFDFLGADPQWEGYADMPEVYVTDARASATGVIKRIAASPPVRRVGRQLSPALKQRMLTVFARGQGSKTTVSNDGGADISEPLRQSLEARLAEDQARFADLLRMCHT